MELLSKYRLCVSIMVCFIRWGKIKKKIFGKTTTSVTKKNNIINY
jgi:hypothetical protein